MTIPTLVTWSEKYFNCTPNEHRANDAWFHEMRRHLTDDGVLYVPCINRSFNKQGEEISNVYK